MIMILQTKIAIFGSFASFRQSQMTQSSVSIHNQLSKPPGCVAAQFLTATPGSMGQLRTWDIIEVVSNKLDSKHLQGAKRLG
jgi:hypothetical protein